MTVGGEKSCAKGLKLFGQKARMRGDPRIGSCRRLVYLRTHDFFLRYDLKAQIRLGPYQDHDSAPVRNEF